MVMLISGLLIRLGHLEFLPTYALLTLGDLTGDVLWYGAGFFWARPLVSRYGRWLSVSDELMDKLEDLFRKHQTKILFISRITMGFGFASVTLMAAGAAKVPIKRFIFINLLGGLIWVGVVLGVGYFLGNAYILIGKGLRDIFIFVVVVLVFLALYGFRKFMKSRFRRTLK